MTTSSGYFPCLSQVSTIRSLLSKADIAEFNADPDLRRRLDESFNLMLAFYGLALDPLVDPPEVRTSGHFEARKPVWIGLHNHNYLRLTRILRSLTLLGLRTRASALLQCLERIYDIYGAAIGPTTMEYWRDAIVT